MGALGFRGVVARKFTDFRSNIRYPAVRCPIWKTGHRAFGISNPCYIVIMAICTLDGNIPERPCRVGVAAPVSPSRIDARLIDVKGDSKLLTELAGTTPTRGRFLV